MIKNNKVKVPQVKYMLSMMASIIMLSVLPSVVNIITKQQSTVIGTEWRTNIVDGSVSGGWPIPPSA